MQTPTSSTSNVDMLSHCNSVYSSLKTDDFHDGSKLPSSPATQTIDSTPRRHFNPLTPSPSFNPFETEYEHLQHQIVTPGLFSKTETPDTKAKPFWAIEHIAALRPVDFGDISERLELQERHCRKIDVLTQHVINKFFENEHIVPSPWGEPVKKINHLANIEEEKPTINESSRNVSCQTDIHIPLSIDFNTLLKNYKLSESQIEDMNKGESFSNSSLRRKLFGNDNDSGPSNQCTPEKLDVAPSQDCWTSPSLGELCASSPVFKNSANRRCSFDADFSDGDAPDLSPISSPQKGSIKETTEDLKLVRSFNVQDKFHLSNSGLITETESEDDVPEMNMSYDFLGVPNTELTNKTKLCKTVDNNMSTLSESGVDECPPTTLGQSSSDAGYQTVSQNTIHDMSIVNEPRPGDQKLCCTHLKSQDQSWEPTGASTPNKLRSMAMF